MDFDGAVRCHVSIDLDLVILLRILFSPLGFLSVDLHLRMCSLVAILELYLDVDC